MRGWGEGGGDRALYASLYVFNVYRDIQMVLGLKGCVPVPGMVDIFPTDLASPDLPLCGHRLCSTLVLDQ